MKTRTTPQSIKEFQAYMDELYGKVNADRSSDYLYGYLSRSVAYLGKNLAQNKADNQHFFRALSWLFSIANYYELDLQKCLFSRFPTICPYCLTRNCICFKTKKQPASYLPAYKASKERSEKYTVFCNNNRDWSMSNAVNTLSSIYPNNEIVWHHAGPWYLIAKMAEEVGELHEAMSKFASNQKPISAIEEELADTFAWILSAWSIVFPSRSLDDAFVDYYYQDCPVCTNFPCSCIDRADRAAELIDPRILEKIRSSLEELERTLPAAGESLAQLRKSVAAAAADQSEPTTVHALKETKGALTKIKDGISTTDDIAQKSISIINSINKMIEMLPWS